MTERDALEAQLRDRGYRLVDRLPDQHPARRRQALRPRNDAYSLPTFPEPGPRREYGDHAHPIETYDPRNEPRPLDLAELLDPRVWIGGGALFAFMVILLLVVLSSGPAPVAPQ
jgi:hypothetical protein